ncbi:MAG TPA: VTT domain-containing protein [Candidatus Paceibacterota bacterium]|jgi:membrane protein DedA with SNARE-associated domain|nr:VTT domain-containing protein [Candidatus Paceibacterota bacterium]
MTETQELIQHVVTLSYGGIFLISLLANVVIPVPEEVVLLAIGYAVRAEHRPFLLVVPIIMAGLLISDLVLYYFSSKSNRFVMAFYNRLFKHQVESRRAWLERHVKKVIFFSRFLVQLRFLGPFFAGQTKVSLKIFVLYEVLAMIIYVPLVVGAGWLFHNSLEHIVSGINVIRNVVLVVAGALIVISLFRSIRKWALQKPSL